LDNNYTIGFSLSRWDYKVEEDGSYSFEQVFVDINTIANVTTIAFSDKGDGL
jgi:hypothetical protein